MTKLTLTVIAFVRTLPASFVLAPQNMNSKRCAP